MSISQYFSVLLNSKFIIVFTTIRNALPVVSYINQAHFLAIYLFDFQFNFDLPFHKGSKPPFAEEFWLKYCRPMHFSSALFILDTPSVRHSSRIGILKFIWILLRYYKFSREFTLSPWLKKFISCNPFSVRKEGKVYSVVKTICHKIIKYTIISLGERQREREWVSHNDSLWETSWFRRNRWAASVWHNR